MPQTIPDATYRLQFNKDFTFAQATILVAYLHELGISHVYASPFLKARSGSPHGYDIVDHNQLNPEIGDHESFNKFIATLYNYDMGLILDFVPNHMGVGGCDNVWWLDVLENGQASPYEPFFDIDWQPVKQELHGKVLLPVLGDHYGAVLDKGELVLHFEAEQGSFTVRYHEHCFPIDPASYPRILLYNEADNQTNSLARIPTEAYQQIIDLFCRLPARTVMNSSNRRNRVAESARCKEMLSRLCRQQPEIELFIQQKIAAINHGGQGIAGCRFLHELLESQAYRLAHWRVAADEINYRRFFNINSLAGLRVEEPEVFAAMHGLVFSMICNKQIQGLRIDHPDGLYDPLLYCRQLVEQASALLEKEAVPDQGAGAAPALYLVVEKILAPFENLPQNWPVHGTTGYDFLNQLNRLLVYAPAEQKMTATYSRFLRKRLDYDELLYEAKKLIITTQLSSELTVLANLINNLSEDDPHTRDFTLNGLRAALIDVVACFPVYRTYITDQNISHADQQYVAWAVSLAKKRNPAAEVSIYDFLREVMLGKETWVKNANPGPGRGFAMKLQQYTAPAMAKAMEDTVFYQYNRLISLNEVGGDPKKFGTSVAAFHQLNQQRRQYWPHTMLATSTHDSKRGEDVRARINVLSELADSWAAHVFRWARINRRWKHSWDGQPAPSRNDEYMLYQNLIGAWPFLPMNDAEWNVFVERMARYFLKAIRESKTRTSWVNPNSQYEQAADHFLRNILDPAVNSRFLNDFFPFQKKIAYLGMFNSLSQLLLKLTTPGVPDIYQGNEGWDFSLVDPDNRRPVDFRVYRQLLVDLRQEFDGSETAAEKLQQMLQAPADGTLKLYVTWRCLQFRQHYPLLFRNGNYLPLATTGSKADHLCGFGRVLEETTVIVAAPRFYGRLLAGQQIMPLGRNVWQDTVLDITPLQKKGPFTNLFTGETLLPVAQNEQRLLGAAGLFARFPVALLAQL